MGKNKIHLKLCSSSGDDDKMTLWVKARKLEAQSTCRVPAAWIRSFDKYSGHHRSGSRFIRSVWFFGMGMGLGLNPLLLLLLLFAK